jgi:hypothetical protein
MNALIGSPDSSLACRFVPNSRGLTGTKSFSASIVIVAGLAGQGTLASARNANST